MQGWRRLCAWERVRFCPLLPGTGWSIAEAQVSIPWRSGDGWLDGWVDPPMVLNYNQISLRWSKLVSETEAYRHILGSEQSN
jgi:hypothetical protein